MTETLDSALKARLRTILNRRQPVTEAELRTLAEQGEACALIIRAQFERAKERLDVLEADPGSSIAEIADTLREVRELGADLEELDALLAGLDQRARELRARWVETL